jgi:hypothetical protein
MATFHTKATKQQSNKATKQQSNKVAACSVEANAL